MTTKMKVTETNTPLKPDMLAAGPQAEFKDIAAFQNDAQPKVEPAETAAPVEEDLEYVRVIRALAMIVIVAEHLAFPLIYRYN